MIKSLGGEFLPLPKPINIEASIGEATVFLVWGLAADIEKTP